jgi:hypothetical protein
LPHRALSPSSSAASPRPARKAGKKCRPNGAGPYSRSGSTKAKLAIALIVSGDCRDLRLPRDARCERRGSQKSTRSEVLAAPHSITSSARNTSPAETSCPIDLAALRLMTNWNRAGARSECRQASVNHAMVAELLHGARRERGFYCGHYGTRMAALVTGHACRRREHRRTRKTVICAGRALADCTEDEIGGHHASLWGTGSIVRVHCGNCPKGALPLPQKCRRKISL